MKKMKILYISSLLDNRIIFLPIEINVLLVSDRSNPRKSVLIRG